MCLNWKKATWIGILLWVLIFVEITILMFLPGLKDNNNLIKIVHLPILAVIVWLLTCWYFKFAENPSAKHGLFVGLYFLVIGTVLDAIITVPLFVKSYSQFYGDYWLWIGYAVLLAVATLKGATFKKCCGSESSAAIVPPSELNVKPAPEPTAEEKQALEKVEKETTKEIYEPVAETKITRAAKKKPKKKAAKLKTKKAKKSAKKKRK